MDKQRRKELKKQYREMKTYMGVYQVISTSSAAQVFLSSGDTCQTASTHSMSLISNPVIVSLGSAMSRRTPK